MTSIPNINKAKKELEKVIIKEILENSRKGDFKAISPNNYLAAYTIIQKMHDSDSKGIYSEILYMHHYNIIQEYIQECYKIISKESSTSLINSFINYTEKINYLIYWMNKTFTYLERFYTKVKNLKTLSQNSMSLYKKYFFTPFELDIYKEVNKLIREDRKGNLESRPIIKTILKILYDIDLANPKIIKKNGKIAWIPSSDEEDRNETPYEDKWYEEYFKFETIKFAKDKGNSDIHNMSFKEYVLSQLKYMDEESVRQREYINPKYHSKINKINYKYLIGEKAQELVKIDKGISYMLANKRNEELKKAFKFFKLFPQSLIAINNEFHSYIKKRVKNIYEKEEINKDPNIFIPELISLKKEMDILVSECFENHPQFQDRKNKAFRLFMNKQFYAEQLSNYIDFCMRIGFKGKSEEEIENKLNEIIELYKCINSKIKLVFQLEINKKMNDRLNKNLSLSINNEKSFISKLKKESGEEYVSKMMGMIDDLEKNKKEID